MDPDAVELTFRPQPGARELQDLLCTLCGLLDEHSPYGYYQIRGVIYKINLILHQYLIKVPVYY